MNASCRRTRCCGYQVRERVGHHCPRRREARAGRDIGQDAVEARAIGRQLGVPESEVLLGNRVTQAAALKKMSGRQPQARKTQPCLPRICPIIIVRVTRAATDLTPATSPRGKLSLKIRGKLPRPLCIAFAGRSARRQHRRPEANSRSNQRQIASSSVYCLRGAKRPPPANVAQRQTLTQNQRQIASSSVFCLRAGRSARRAWHTLVPKEAFTRVWRGRM